MIVYLGTTTPPQPYELHEGSPVLFLLPIDPAAQRNIHPSRRTSAMGALIIVRCRSPDQTQAPLLGPGSISRYDPHGGSRLHEVNVGGLNRFFHYVRSHAPLLGQFADVTARDCLTLGQITNWGSGGRGSRASLARGQPVQLERLAPERSLGPFHRRNPRSVPAI